MLNKKTCIPCQGGIPPLNSEEISKYLNDINENWINLINVKISRTFNFNNYLEALNFVNKIAYLSEDEGHHPHVHLNFKNVEVIIFTHKINGLHENDFILAAKCDDIWNSINN
ncbi:4a-hydroxytetrahydrobiopterin dehydratase [Flavobacteriales bacterium]|jgi:4a-hydroxytetrahydrobiopterin dehydratase|nr:4a-hydroxytetrahydrobiopterin dehydratase [Flavobacteriales bacterium]|tara:strand:+ start:3153 stop:3491 length:339 start_codon:yes stop_codon:yes gene_type:complete